MLKKNIANTFGSFGYLSGFLQWLWAVTLYLSVIQSTTSFIFPKSGEQAEHAPGPIFTLPDPVGVIIVVMMVIIMVGITIYALISVPRNIVKTSNQIVHKTAETMTPLVIRAQHKHDTKHTRIKITSGLMLVIKLLSILMPLILTAGSKFLDEQSIDYSIALIVGCGLASISVMLFVFQYLLAKLLRVKISDLW